MTISFPRTDILDTFFLADQMFKLQSRQELNTQANGIVRGKDMGSALWMAEYTTAPIHRDDAPAAEAKLWSLDGVINPFTACDLRRPYPALYPTGVFNDTGTLHTVDSNRKSIRIQALDAAFQLSIGDYLAFDYGGSRALHQVVEAATANGSGLTPLFEVRPHVREGYSIAGAVVLKNPKGFFTLLPNSIEQQLQGIHTVLRFKAVQYL